MMWHADASIEVDDWGSASADEWELAPRHEKSGVHGLAGPSGEAPPRKSPPPEAPGM